MELPDGYCGLRLLAQPSSTASPSAGGMDSQESGGGQGQVSSQVWIRVIIRKEGIAMVHATGRWQRSCIAAEPHTAAWLRLRMLFMLTMWFMPCCMRTKLPPEHGCILATLRRPAPGVCGRQLSSLGHLCTGTTILSHTARTQ